jgi:hypothetical protein
MADLDIPDGYKDAPHQQFAESGLQDYSGDAKARRDYRSRYIMPSTEHDFLQKQNPMFCGKMSLALLLAQNEVQLQMANESPDIGCMAYLYVTAR